MQEINKKAQKAQEPSILSRNLRNITTTVLTGIAAILVITNEYKSSNDSNVAKPNVAAETIDAEDQIIKIDKLRKISTRISKNRKS